MLRTRFSRLSQSGALPQEADATAGEGNQRLFEHLISEVHGVAVDIAVVATAANALNDWRARTEPADIARFAPHAGTLEGLLPVLDAHHILSNQASADLLAFMGALTAARATLDAYLDDCDVISAERAGPVHGRSLGIRWRALALEARQLLVALETACPAPLPELFSQNTRVVCALLSGAGNGLKPCLDENGRLYVPPLPQRRRAPRRTVLQNCLVNGPDHVQTGFIRDASAGGLGLGRISSLKRGDRVRIDLANGRQLHGVVAWVTGSSAGVRFDVALEPTDSLIAV
jgi:PilZ domain